MMGIQSCDVFIAYLGLNFKSAYGTMAEIGAAHAWGKPIVLVVHPKLVTDDFWFLKDMAIHVITSDNPADAVYAWLMRPRTPRLALANSAKEFTEAGKRVVLSLEFSQRAHDIITSCAAREERIREYVWYFYVRLVAWVVTGHILDVAPTSEEAKVLHQLMMDRGDELSALAHDGFLSAFPLTAAKKTVSLPAEPAVVEPNENPKPDAGTPRNVAA
jgi:hypothetical protein